ncbi:amino acid ABC transporter permease [Pseudovibrio sp. Tun.PSC04-5.I4]|uniref:amino acid ABC transporter permease n=1 Tax=Pseudovibrio sp. Tun.PSC04-5.I4 TaxID=1798213 RepID=UPI000890161A|nr:amino acid ABC transporter permease [Pseudovibrio sp. Tun.PSC04-5.I4]SDQ32999.1 amino acid ABC transporter membrane protein 2, PAAT family [Pseudovibrio sp. Tun.PSC04-5.I4]
MDMIADKLSILQSLFPFLLKGLWMTFQISMISIIVGSLIGFCLGVTKTLGYFFLNKLINGYLHILRGSPYLVQLYIIFFVLPSLGIAWLSFDGYTAAIVSLSLYTSSYVTEIVASAIFVVPRGQSEAARSVGMTWGQTYRNVVIPQALKLTIPPMASVYVIVIKSTAVFSVIGIAELTRQGEVAIMRMPGDIMFIYGLIAVFYFIYCYPVLWFSKWAEGRFGSVSAENH